MSDTKRYAAAVDPGDGSAVMVEGDAFDVDHAVDVLHCQFGPALHVEDPSVVEEPGWAPRDWWGDAPLADDAAEAGA
jgi:hypothetical protein